MGEIYPYELPPSKALLTKERTLDLDPIEPSGRHLSLWKYQGNNSGGMEVLHMRNMREGGICLLQEFVNLS
jgi:hypothetical protein